MLYFLRSNYRRIKNYFFNRPDVQAGDKLVYYGKTVESIYFNRDIGLWFLNLGSYSISWSLEQEARKYPNRYKLK